MMSLEQTNKTILLSLHLSLLFASYTPSPTQGEPFANEMSVTAQRSFHRTLAVYHRRTRRTMADFLRRSPNASPTHSSFMESRATFNQNKDNRYSSSSKTKQTKSEIVPKHRVVGWCHTSNYFVRPNILSTPFPTSTHACTRKMEATSFSSPKQSHRRYMKHRLPLAFMPAFSSSVSCPWKNYRKQGNRKDSTFHGYVENCRYFSQRGTLSNASNSNHYNPNRYDRFRHRLHHISNDDLSKSKANHMEIAKCTMELLSSNRRSFHRTWKRMSPLVELVILACSDECYRGDGSSGMEKMESGEASPVSQSCRTPRRMTSIADVGCDHGILSLTLACMAWVASQGNIGHDNFISRVIGTDLSSQALKKGGFVSLKKINDVMSRMYGNFDVEAAAKFQTKEKFDDKSSKQNIPEHAKENERSFFRHLNFLPIEFRIGNGLAPLQPGEAEGVVLAGMGVHTMLDILLGTKNGVFYTGNDKECDDVILSEKIPVFTTTTETELTSTSESGYTTPACEFSLSDTLVDTSFSDSLSSTMSPLDASPLNKLETRFLFLQPTNSRPRHLILLYDRLQKSGEWTLKDERITFVSGRWYISSLFESSNANVLESSRNESNLKSRSTTRKAKSFEFDENDKSDMKNMQPFRYPGHFLRGQMSQDSIEGATYDAYVRHHLQWLKQDYERWNGSLEADDARWMRYIISKDSGIYYENLASWFDPDQ